MVYAQLVLRNETHKPSWDFAIQTGHLIPARRPDLVIVNKKKKKMKNRTSRIVSFDVLADHRVKSNEGEKKRD